VRKFICFCFAVALLAVGNVAFVQEAQARWKPEYVDAPHREWFAQQRDGEGWSCCDLSDAHPVYNAYIREGTWYVPINGIHYEIQPRQLLGALIRSDMQSFGMTVLAIT
jgi:hypothetical protein